MKSGHNNPSRSAKRVKTKGPRSPRAEDGDLGEEQYESSKECIELIRRGSIARVQGTEGDRGGWEQGATM